LHSELTLALEGDRTNLITRTEQRQPSIVVTVVPVPVYARFVRAASDGSSIDDRATPVPVWQFPRDLWKVSIIALPDVFAYTDSLHLFHCHQLPTYPPTYLNYQIEIICV